MNGPLERPGHGRSRRELETSIASAIFAVTRAQFVRLHTLVDIEGETLVIVSSQVDGNGVYWTTAAAGSEEWTVSAELLSDHPLMRRAVNQLAPVRKLESSTGLHHCFYPVCVQGQVRALVELKENHRPYPDEDALISSFIALYINYVHWLDGSDLDPLTGLPGGHALEPAMRRVLADVTPRGAVQGCGQCLALVAIDAFADIVQCYGHLFGDELLRRLARRLGDRFAAPAQIFCLGTEFAVLLPAARSHQVELAFAAFLQEMSEIEWPNSGSWRLSVGLSQLAPGDTPECVLERARRALETAQSRHPGRISRPGAR